jgi:hypothetical protein
MNRRLIVPYVVVGLAASITVAGAESRSGKQQQQQTNDPLWLKCSRMVGSGPSPGGRRISPISRQASAGAARFNAIDECVRNGGKV